MQEVYSKICLTKFWAPEPQTIYDQSTYDPKFDLVKVRTAILSICYLKSRWVSIITHVFHVFNRLNITIDTGMLVLLVLLLSLFLDPLTLLYKHINHVCEALWAHAISACLDLYVKSCIYELTHFMHYISILWSTIVAVFVLHWQIGIAVGDIEKTHKNAYLKKIGLQVISSSYYIL